MRQYTPRYDPSVLFSGLPLFLTIILMLSPTAVQSQSASATGRLEGIVTDSTGAAVPGADITVRNQNTGISTTLQSGAEGDFTFLYLDPGTYEVTIQKGGFNKLVLKDITVTVGTRAIIHPRLAVGRIETTVSVSATTPLVDSAESSLGTVVDQQSIEPCRHLEILCQDPSRGRRHALRVCAEWSRRRCRNQCSITWTWVACLT